MTHQKISVGGCGWLLLFFVQITSAVDIMKAEWEENNIDLSVAMLRFSDPGKGGTDFSGDRFNIEKINILDDKLFNISAMHDYVVFEHLWAYKGHFWQGYVGELLLQVVVQKMSKPDQTLEERFSNADNNEKITLNGTEWIKSYYYKEKGDKSTLAFVMYATSLTNEHFLIVQFNYIDDDSTSNNTEWMEKAQQYVDAIIPTLKIEWRTESPPDPSDHQPAPSLVPVFPVR